MPLNCNVKQIKVPNIGDFKDVEVIKFSYWSNFQKNDPLITIESDKSSVEIPSTLKEK